METINISKKRFDTLKKYEIPDYVCNTEGVLYILPTKENWHNKNKLLKKLYLTSGMSFGNKLWTINSLIDSRNKINIDEIVFPEKIATVNNEIVGFTMPLIESINLTTALKSKKISNEQKIKYLKQIGQILNQMKKVREYTDITDFYINDLHESNFIVDKNDNVKLIDIDSCKINGNQIFSSKYLATGKFINEVYKYQKDEFKQVNKYQKYFYDPFNSFIPDENTDLYCYIIVILNFLYEDNINDFTIAQFYEYLEYLNKIGLSKEILDIFEKIAISTPNDNPYELLDEIKPIIGRSNHIVYTYIKNKSI